MNIAKRVAGYIFMNAKQLRTAVTGPVRIGFAAVLGFLRQNGTNPCRLDLRERAEGSSALHLSGNTEQASQVIKPDARHGNLRIAGVRRMYW